MYRLFEKTAPDIIHFGWEHGRYADFWSVIHVLTGTLLGILAFSIGISPLHTLLYVAGIATLYEVIEIILHVSEDAENVATDIILTAGGSFVVQYIITIFHLTPTSILWAFIGILIFEIFLLSLGWRYYLKKKMQRVREKNNS